MYCESRHEAHQGRMFANMALVVARLRRSLRARLQQSIVKSASISCTPSPEPQTVEFMYYIRETQLVYWIHNCTVLVPVRPLQQRIPDLLALTTYIGRPHQAPAKYKNIEYWRTSPPYCILDYEEFFLTVWDYSKCSTPSPPSPTNKSSK